MTELAKRGGEARARKLTEEERRDIARRAAAARWGTTIHVATHRGQLKIGDILIECAVLEDETRLLSQSTVLQALGRNPEKSRRSRNGGELRAPFLAANNLQPYISDELKNLADPIPYRIAGESGRMWGYRAEMLPMVCEVYTDAALDRKLTPNQRPAAVQARILARALAKVGITALVDEATGYQEVRRRDELRLLLEKYVQEEFRPWIKTFPDDFFAQIYRLYGWQQIPGSNKRPGVVGRLINKYVYDQLPVGVHDELKRLNPKNDRGNRSRRHHQFLTADTGNAHLDRQISTVTTLLRMARDKSDFDDLFERAFPPPQVRLPYEIAVKVEES